VAAQRAQVAQVDSGIKQLRINIENTSIRSPVDGVVISRAAEVGQTVASGLQVATLFTIAEDLSAMQVDTSVSEGDIGKIADRQRVLFSVDAFAGKTFEGVVRQIRNQPTTVSNVVTYNAVIDVANPGGELRPGMTASVTFIVDELADAVQLPNAALRFQPTPRPSCRPPA
jgi:HlyD family secretion protein